MPTFTSRLNSASLRLRRGRSRGSLATASADRSDPDRREPTDEYRQHFTSRWLADTMLAPDEYTTVDGGTPPPAYTTRTTADEVAPLAPKDEADGYGAVLLAFATGFICALGIMLSRPSSLPPPTPSLHDVAEGIAALREEVASLRALVTRA